MTNLCITSGCFAQTLTSGILAQTLENGSNSAGHSGETLCFSENSAWFLRGGRGDGDGGYWGDSEIQVCRGEMAFTKGGRCM